ncbi:hypothetical protein MNBD_ALPHA06-305 [hydrothermal vent metagenome]|uniref:DUF2066 domain-containing protein n=1 Tax=hydrothermal vent metagenome TaxID=652676 RepID=A0A3B0RMD6_9ZZZZ
MKLLQLILLVTGLFVVFAGAASADVFTVSNVAIDGYGASVTEARKAAIRTGTKDAANLLIERLTLQNDRLNAGWEQMDADIAAQMVAGIQIRNEQRSDRRYLGLLQVSFDRQRVRDFLNAQQIPFVEAQKANALVLPVWATEDGDVLWSENLWWQTWANAAPNHDLTPLNLPLADLGDRQAITALEAKLLNSDALLQIAARYDVQQIIVAIASVTAPVPALDTVPTPVLQRVRIEVSIVDWDANQRPRIRNFDIYAEGDNLRQAYQIARTGIISDLQQQWKSLAVVRTGTMTKVRITASFANQTEWQRISKALAGSSLVREARLDALSNDGALMMVTYVGTRAQLAVQLAQSGVEYVDTEIGPVARVR